jgi:hypothetical protein
MSSNDENSGTLGSCGCMIIILILNFFVGGWSVNYLLSVFSHTIPFFWAAVIGTVAGEVSIPAAIVVYILRSFNVI